MDTISPLSWHRTRRHTLAAAVALGLAAGGCGGGGGVTASPPGPSAPEAGASASGSATSQSQTSKQTVHSTDPVTRTTSKPVKARGGQGEHSEETTSVAPRQNPCQLVSRAEASAIVGRQVTNVTTAPQGPTCIYQLRNSRRTVTLAIEQVSVAALRNQARALSEVKIHGRPAYCVKLGNAMTLVPLSGGRALNVTAPCPMAASFVAKALPRVR